MTGIQVKLPEAGQDHHAQSSVREKAKSNQTSTYFSPLGNPVTYVKGFCHTKRLNQFL